MNQKMLIGGGIVVILCAFIYGNAVATNKAEDALSELQSEVTATGGSLIYEDVSASLLGTVEVEGLTVDYRGESFDVESVIIKGLENDPNDIDDLILTVEGISFLGFNAEHVDTTPRDPLEVLIYAAVVDGNVFDITLALSAYRDSNILSLKTLTLAGEDLGKLALSTSMISPALFTDSPDYSQPLEVTDFSLSAQDDGLAQRWFELEAQRQDNTDADDIRDKLVRMGESELERLQGFEKDLVAGVLALIDGDEVTLSRANETPLKIDPFAMLNKQYLRNFTDQANMTIAID